MPVGSSSVANEANTTTGAALYTVANANNGLGDDVGGSGVVNQYTGGTPPTPYFILLEVDGSGNILLESGTGYIQLQN